MVDNKRQYSSTGLSDRGAALAMPGRVNILFYAAFIIAVIAILMPVQANLLGVIDGLWILCFCMTAAILMLSVIAKDISDLSGFTLMIILTTMLKFGVAIISAKAIIMVQAAGNLVEKMGYLSNISDRTVAGSIIPFAVAAGVAIVFMVTTGVFRKSSKYAVDTLPFKYVSADADLNAGVINEMQANEIKEKIAGESRFYLSIAAAARFLRFEAIFSVLTVVSALVGSLTFVSGNSSADGATMDVNLTLTLGITLVIFIPAIVMAFACAAAAGRKNLYITESFNAVKTGMKLQNISEQTDDEKMELLNPDFSEVAERVIARKITVEDVSKTAKKTSSENSDADAVMEMLQQGSRVVLFGSESVESLPVTGAVGIAVKVADSGKKCVLIDADVERNAVYKVFDIESGKTEQAVESCVDNLSVWAVDPDAEGVGIDIADKIVREGDAFDCIVVYAPKIIDGEYYGKLAGFVNLAVLAVDRFDGQNGQHYIYQLKELLESVECKCVLKAVCR